MIVDEIYLGLTYDGDAARARSTVADDAFVISSFSKYFNMTGWRLGWIVAPERHVRDLEKLAQNLYISPPTPSQHAALACFEPETLAILEARRRAFEARRDFLVPALRELGFGIPVMPTGGFFVYADCSRFSRRQRALLPRRARQAPASRSRRASTSAAIAPPSTCASPTRSGRRKLEDGVGAAGALPADAVTHETMRRRVCRAWRARWLRGAALRRFAATPPTTTGRAPRGS